MLFSSAECVACNWVMCSRWTPELFAVGLAPPGPRSKVLFVSSGVGNRFGILWPSAAGFKNACFSFDSPDTINNADFLRLAQNHKNIVQPTIAFMSNCGLRTRHAVRRGILRHSEI